MLDKYQTDWLNTIDIATKTLIYARWDLILMKHYLQFFFGIAFRRNRDYEFSTLKCL